MEVNNSCPLMCASSPTNRTPSSPKFLPRRYSLDVDGLAYAGGERDADKYKTIIPDKDNIIPICDDEYFDDDIVGRFVEFVRKIYGDDTLEENLKFVADALGGKGTPLVIIRSYEKNPPSPRHDDLNRPRRRREGELCQA